MWRGLALAAGIALAIVAVPAVRHLRERPPAAPPLVHAALIAPDGGEFGAGDVTLDAAISPDGRAAAFVATAEGRVQLWRRMLDGDRAEPLPGTDGASRPAWKPGGGVIAFFADGVLKQIAVDERTIRALTPAPEPAGAAWLEDGSLLFVPVARGPVRLMRNGVITDATRLAAGDVGHASPTSAGDGAFVYVALRMDGSRVVRYVDDSGQFDLDVTSSHAELVGDVLVRVRDGVLLAQRVDRQRHVLLGRATPLVSSVGVSPAGRGFFATSPRLVLAAAPAANTRELIWLDARGRRLSSIAEPGAYWQVRLSPDDRYAAVTALDPLLRTLDVFAFATDAAARAERVSLSLGADADPVWSPDGARVAFRTAQRGAAGISSRAIGRGAAEEVLLRSDGDETPSDWRGRQLLFHASSTSGGRDIWLLDLANGTRTQVTRGAFNEWEARWSPDGTAIAFTSDESGQPDVYVDRWPAGGGRVRVSQGGGSRPRWSADGRTVYFVRGNQVLQAARTRAGGDNNSDRRGDGIEFTVPEIVVVADGLVDFDPAHRGDRVAILTGVHRAGRSVITLVDWAGRVQMAPR